MHNLTEYKVTIFGGCLWYHFCVMLKNVGEIVIQTQAFAGDYAVFSVAPYFAVSDIMHE